MQMFTFTLRVEAHISFLPSVIRRDIGLYSHWLGVMMIIIITIMIILIIIIIIIIIIRSLTQPFVIYSEGNKGREKRERDRRGEGRKEGRKDGRKEGT